MSYQVLARKWRPSRFEELVGQDHVVRALRNALESGRIHHAYLFTGTRGVGKTTIARILAKSLNCEQGLGPNPCGECATCREISEGRYVDLIEVDAASRTKVEDTRDLLDNVPYAPVRGRYKVYLIDEVHMFSKHSFNALLKTLEEPPPHARFVLATTDPELVPVTILSRCLQFSLRRLDVHQISDKLQQIVGSESIDADAAALSALARAADGSMRDALSLMDQAIAFGAGSVRAEDVDAMLGAVGVARLEQVFSALATGDGQALMAAAQELNAEAADSARVLADMAAILQRMAVMQLVPDSIAEDSPDIDLLRRFAAELDAETIQLWYQVALHGRRDLELVVDPHSGLLMTLVRMLAFKPDEGAGASAPTAAGRPSRPTTAPPKAPAPARSAPAQRTAMPSAPAAPESKAASHPPAAEHAPHDVPAETVAPGSEPPWPQLVNELGLKGISLEVAQRLQWVSSEEQLVCFHIAQEHDAVMTPTAVERLRQALVQRLGRELKIKIEAVESLADTPQQQREAERDARQLSAEQAMANDPNVAALQENFGARIVPGSVRPRDD